MELAKIVSGWSKDPSSKVGSVITRDRRVLATGYNGFPPGIDDSLDRLSNREEKYRLVVHAEMNAMIQAGRECIGSTIYVWTPFGGVPCSNCSKHLITAGIRRVVAAHPVEPGSNWEADCLHAEGILREAGVKILYMEQP